MCVWKWAQLQRNDYKRTSLTGKHSEQELAEENNIFYSFFFWNTSKKGVENFIFRTK